MLQNVLDNIIPVLILQQGVGVLVKLLQDWSCLLRDAMFKDSLDYTAAVRMSGQRVDLKQIKK